MFRSSSTREMDGTWIAGRPRVHQQVGRMEFRSSSLGISHVGRVSLSWRGRAQSVQSPESGISYGEASELFATIVSSLISLKSVATVVRTRYCTYVGINWWYRAGTKNLVWGHPLKSLQVSGRKCWRIASNIWTWIPGPFTIKHTLFPFTPWTVRVVRVAYCILFYCILLFAFHFDDFHETGSGNDAIDGIDGIDGIESNTLRTDINYLEKPSCDTVTKCDKIDKLHTLWHEPIASFPEEPVKLLYVNDQQASNHYESPIKIRNTSVTSNSENDLVTPINEQRQSYIDMKGKRSAEAEDLLVFSGTNDNDHETNTKWEAIWR